MKKAQYQTKQMIEIISYLKSREGQHITVSDVSAYFKERGVNMGTATIYRQLDKMVNKGIVAKYTVDGNTSACFEYLGEEKNCHKPVCYHCKCEKCGKLIHLQCNEVESLRKHILDEHGFEINPMRTVFFGLCKECRNESVSNLE